MTGNSGWRMRCIPLGKLVVCLSAALILCLPASAIELDRLNSQFTLRSWDSQTGLPSDSVWDVHVADDGYLWVATEGGLVRFDGFQFEVFNSLTHDAFAVDDVRRIAAAPDGSLWVSTYGGGVVHVAGNTLRRYDVQDGIDNPVTYSVAVAADGSVWAATETSACLLKAGSERFECFNEASGLGSRRVFDMAQASDGKMWFISLASGVSSFDGDSFTNFATDFGLETPPFFLVDADPVFDVIFATYLGDYFALKDNAFDRVEFEGTPKGMIPIAFHRDQDGNAWVGSTTHGLSRVLPAYRGFVDLLGELQVFSIADDADGSLWIGTTEGLYYLSAPPFIPWGKPEGLADDTFVVAEAPGGDIWAGTEGDGLYRLGTDGVIDNYTEDDGLPAASVSALMIEPNGLVWAGTFSSGIAWLRDGKVVGILSEEDGLASNQVSAIHQDSKGAVWIGTSSGLQRFSNGKISHWLGSESGLEAGLVRHISETDDGRLLLSTSSGLAIVDTDRVEVVETLTRADGLGSNIIATSYIDERGVTWLGGRSGGLTRMENGEVFSFLPSHRLGIDSIMGIAEDAYGFLWLAGRNGIARIPREQLDAVAAGTAEYVEARPINLSDGLRSPRVPGGFQTPVIRARDGRVWMATGEGLVVIDPAEMEPRGTGVNVIFDQVIADGEALPIRSGATLPAGTRTVQVNYSVPRLNDGAALRFRYRLRGIDERWQEAGERRAAFFTSLTPQDYVLEVQATLEGRPFADSAEGAGAFEFAVAPLWHQTMAVQIAKWLLVLGVFGWLFQYLSLHYRRRAQRLESLVIERTGELTAALNEVQRLSRIDTLTQVANRRHFEERLEEAWASAEENGDPVSVMIVDIDHFKAFNDAVGHQAGDHALKTVAQALASAVREQDFVARYGGEEFIILLAGTDTDVAREIGLRVQQRIRDLNLRHPGLGNGDVLTVSAGFATAKPGDTSSAEALIGRADEALYQAKAEGRDRLVTASPRVREG